MRIGLITTLGKNIGDDFIREGICRILRQLFRRRELEFVPIDKHQPYSMYPKWHPVSWAPRGKRILGRVLYRFGFSSFDSCDLIVQCGAPVIWPGCHRCEWARPLWYEVAGRLSGRIPVLNLAAGSCYPWEAQPEQIDDPSDAEYLRAILGFCKVTTTRDTLAQHLYTSLGTQTQLIPCSAFLAAGDNAAKPCKRSPILINYMSGGGHYDWKQGIDKRAWEETVRTLIRKLAQRHDLTFLCHDEEEHRLASDLDSSLPRLWPKTPEEYFAVISGAKAALCNRMHASVSLAGMGIPSVAVCTDTRLLMVKAIGLPCTYVKDAHADRLEDQIEGLIVHGRQERERLLSLRERTWEQYVAVVSDATE